MQTKISAVVLTRDNEDQIAKCLTSLTFCDEIVVIDDFSDDKTASIIKDLGAKVYQRHLNDDFAAQRNFALEQVTHDWVLFVDSDEVVPNDLQKEITSTLEKDEGKHDGYHIKRNDFQFGKWLKHGETAHVSLLRLGKKNAGIWTRAIHETWDISGSVGVLKNPLEHYPHQTISEFLHDIDHYTTLHARIFEKEGRTESFLSIGLYPFGKFLQNFIVRGGILDGTAGFLMAAFMSFHSFLSRAKLYLLQNKPLP